MSQFTKSFQMIFPMILMETQKTFPGPGMITNDDTEIVQIKCQKFFFVKILLLRKGIGHRSRTFTGFGEVY